MIPQKIKERRWRDSWGGGVKSAGCSSREPDLVTSTHIRPLTTVCKSSSIRSNALLWTHTYIKNQGVVAHTFNPSKEKVEAGRSLSSRSARVRCCP